MANLKFYKKSTAPTGIQGAIWFDTTKKRINLYESNEWIPYGGDLKDASFANSILTLTKVDGSTVTVNLSGYATQSAVVAAIGEINKQFETINSNYSTLAEKVSTLETTTNGVDGKISTAINNLNATVRSNDGTSLAVPSGKHVAVEVVETNGKLTSVTVKENDIASASALSTLSGSVSNLGNAIDVLKGEDTGSIRDIAIDVLTETLVDENASEAYNELKEISAWIKQHPQEAATMNSDIATLKTNVQTLQNKTVVDSFGGKTGAITLKSNATTNGTVNFTMNNNELTGTVYGLKALAYKDSLGKSDVGLGNVTNLAASNYLTDLSSNTTNAVSITVGGTTKNIAAATMKTSLGLKSAAYAETSAFDAAGSAAAVLGTNKDEKTANTVYGAKAYADSLFTWAEYE